MERPNRPPAGFFRREAYWMVLLAVVPALLAFLGAVVFPALFRMFGSP